MSHFLWNNRRIYVILFFLIVSVEKKPRSRQRIVPSVVPSSNEIIDASQSTINEKGGKRILYWYNTCCYDAYIIIACFATWSDSSYILTWLILFLFFIVAYSIHIVHFAVLLKRIKLKRNKKARITPSSGIFCRPRYLRSGNTYVWSDSDVIHCSLRTPTAFPTTSFQQEPFCFMIKLTSVLFHYSTLSFIQTFIWSFSLNR